MSLWRSPKPVIAQVHGWCVGGGSDMALCADLVIASEDARIGTSYSRMWGCYLSGMWLYRLGLTKAKEYALTGQTAVGRRSRRGRADQRGRAVRAARGGGAPSAPRSSRRSRSRSSTRDEADRQPGLREHGPRLDAAARPDPRRADAQHPRRARASSSWPSARASARAVALRDGAVRRLQPGAARASGRTRTNVIEARPELRRLDRAVARASGARGSSSGSLYQYQVHGSLE